MPSNRYRGSNKELCAPCVKMKNAHRGQRDPRDAKYCPKHQCPINAPGGIVCPRHKKGLHERCDIHSICDFEGCQNPKHSDGTAISHEFCREHACAIEGCGDGKVYSPDQNVHSDLCARHASMKCLSPVCQNWKAVGAYCQQHSCTVGNCGKIIVQDRPFCSEHNTCTITQCTDQKLQRDGKFEDVCNKHYIPPCHQNRCPYKSQVHSRYCKLHSCIYPGCSAKAQPTGIQLYCDQHKCHIYGCQTMAKLSEVNGDLQTNTYCTNHKCESLNCTNHTALEKPGVAFCVSHCCTNPTCNRAREEDPRLKTLCLDHYNETFVEKGKNQVLEDTAPQLQAMADELRQARLRQARQERRPYSHGSQPQYPPNSQGRYYYDERYRSNPNSDWDYY